MTPPTPIPAPPEDLLAAALPGRGGGTVAPALDVEAWVRAEILSADRPLSNYDHAHLGDAGGWPRVAFLWTTEHMASNGRRVLGTCQLAEPTGKAWPAAQRRCQLTDWFGEVPVFLIVLDARFAAHALATSRPENLLAVIEHELYHAAQKRDPYGAPLFTADGEPRWGMRDHDTEEFAGVVRRYGIAASPNASPLVAAADYVRAHGPDVAQASLDGLCGTCKRAVA